MERIYNLSVMNAFEILAAPTRRRIVELLASGELSVGELCARFAISQPAVSRQLRVLREAGLVASRAEAQRRLYSLRPEPLEEIERWLERYRSFWGERLDRLDDVLALEEKKATKVKRKSTRKGKADGPQNAARRPEKGEPRNERPTGRHHDARRK